MIKMTKKCELNPHICLDCGQDYLKEQHIEAPANVWVNPGICCVCGTNKDVAHIRNYYYLRDKPKG